jgi:hypothetical protein
MWLDPAVNSFPNAGWDSPIEGKSNTVSPNNQDPRRFNIGEL